MYEQFNLHSGWRKSCIVCDY